MESVQSILASANTRVLKEPKGFMKVLQFIFGICAFATTTSFSATFEINVSCSANVTDTTPITASIYYPFSLDHLSGPVDVCDEKPILAFMGNFSSDAGFYVAVGVLAFLYSLAALGVYIFLGPIYENNSNFPIGITHSQETGPLAGIKLEPISYSLCEYDCAMHVVFAVLFLAGSSAWANSLTSMRSAVDFDFIKTINDGVEDWEGDLCSKFTCYEGTAIRFNKLVISLILGFLNVFLWGSNLWFLYKETPHFKARQGDAGVTQEAVGGTA